MASQEIIDALRKQLEEHKIVPLYTEEEKAQIRKGRKGQKEIDEGRRQIEENQRLHLESVAKRDELIGRLQQAPEAFQKQTKQQSREEEASSIGGIARQYGPPLAGAGAGTLYAALTNRGLDAYEPAMRGL